jgi:hypothetical protein
VTINIQPPPTWTLPIDTKTGSFDPVWLKWFIDLAGVLNQTSGSPHLQHNLLGGLQGGIAGPPTEYYHLTSAQHGLFTSGTVHQVLHGDPTLPTWSSLSLTADVSGVLPIANGGTNSSTALSGSSIAISNGTAIVQGAAGTTTTVLHGNASGAPTYSAVSLTADITGTLPVGNGGTGSSTAPSSGQLPIGNAGGTAYAPQSMSGDATISNAGALTLATVATAGTNTKITFNVKGLVTSATAATLASSDYANQGTTVTVLHGNAAGNPSWSAVSLSTDVTGTLQAAQEPAHTGDVTNTAGSLALTIAAQAVTYAKIQNISATSRFLGRKTAGAGSTEELSASDAKTILGYTLASSDFVNQGTTTTVLHGNAAGNPSFAAVSLTADVSGILPAANGGTNNGFTAFTGPATSTKTFTLPNASDTVACLAQSLTWTNNHNFQPASGVAVTVTGTGSATPVEITAGNYVIVTKFRSDNASGGYMIFNISGNDVAYIGSASQVLSGNARDFAITTSAAFNLLLGTNNATQFKITSGSGVACAGTTTNDSAAAGYIGEYVTASVASASSVSLTSTTTANITSISLTAGDWDVDGIVDYTAAGTTVVTALKQGSSSTSATLGATDTFSTADLGLTGPANDPAIVIPTVRYSLSTTTTIYLVTNAVFSVSTLKAYGTIRARRVR